MSLIIWAVWAAIALYYSFDLNALIGHSTATIRAHGELHHATPWLQAGDTWAMVDAGRFVWNGALGYVYQGLNTYALPLSFILTAPISGLIDHYQLVEGAPYPVAEPSAWLVVAPYALAYGLPLLVAIRRLAWDLGGTRRLWMVQAACVPLVLLPAFFWGHFDDLLALTFTVWAIRQVLRSQWVGAALLLSLAVSSKQWAAMVLPVLIFMTPRGTRLKVVTAAVALPAVLASFALAVNWHDASKALFSPVNLGRGTQGHMSFYATWFGSHTSRISRTLGMLLTIPAGWLLRRAVGGRAFLAAVALLFLVRPLSEAISFSYYWSPALLMAGLVSIRTYGTFRARDWIAPVAAVLWATPRVSPSGADWWWAGELILLTVTVVQVVSNCGWNARLSDQVPSPIKKSVQAPILHPMRSASAVGETSWTR